MSVIFEKASHRWEDCLPKGKIAEYLLRDEIWPKKFPSLGLIHQSEEEGKRKEPDFIIKKYLALMEGKGESHPTSVNIFTERFWNRDARIDGGVFQSLKKGVDLYAIIFQNQPRQLYLYPAVEFAERLLKAIAEGVAVEYWGDTSTITEDGSEWESLCYLVPRDYFSDLLIETEQQLVAYLEFLEYMKAG